VTRCLLVLAAVKTKGVVAKEEAKDGVK